MKYKKIAPVTKEKAESILASDSSIDQVKEALLGAALNEKNDWKWLQDLCIKYSKHSDKSVQGAAILCFGHIARVHGHLEKDVVLPIIHNAQKDKETSSRANDALDDINVFLS